MSMNLSAVPAAAEPSLAAPAVARAEQAVPAPLPVWVLLRGLSRESGHWGIFPDHLLRELRSMQPSSQLLLLDLPGTGTLRRQASPTQVSAIVDACRAELQRRGVKGAVSLG
jgi:hypothetical protein